MRVGFWLAVLAAGAVAVPALAQDADPGKVTVFSPQRLALTDIPKPTGKRISLFNGKSLKTWDAWLGYADPAETYRADHGTPVGVAGKGDIFSVKMIDGKPAIFVSGKTWGSLVNTGDYGNYHLRLQYRWTGKRYAPRLDQPENNGLLYHSHGAPGAVWGTWSRAIEFEIMTGSVGMVVPVGAGVTAETSVASDATLIDPKLRFMVGGAKHSAIGNTAEWNVENNSNADKPVGEWNTLDLYVMGDHAIHVVNGVPVMEVWGLCDPEPSGVCAPLTHGHIQLQSEGAETYFRNITLEPIDHLPKIAVAK